MIQGTSGCGKSTLIKCLAGKTQNESSGVTGSITFSDGLGEISQVPAAASASASSASAAAPPPSAPSKSTTVHAFPHNPLNSSFQVQTWANFQSHLGYVPQDDVVHDDLNVRDNIGFAIQLKRAGLAQIPSGKSPQ